MVKKSIKLFISIIIIIIIAMLLFFLHSKIVVREKIRKTAEEIVIEYEGNQVIYNTSIEIEKIFEILDMDYWHIQKIPPTDTVPSFYTLINNAYLIKFYDNGVNEVGYCCICDFDTNIEYQSYRIDSNIFDSIRSYCINNNN